MVKALRDQAPTVRSNAKRSMETLCIMNRDVLDKLLENAEVTRDTRIRKLLLKIQAGETMGDDVSVASSRMGSVASRSSYRPGGSARVSVRDRAAAGGDNNKPKSNNFRSRSRPPSHRGIPTSIGVESPPPVTGAGLGMGPPMRVAPFQAATDIVPQAVNESNNNGVEPLAHESEVATGESFDLVLPVIASTLELTQFAQTQRLNSRRSSLLQERLAKSHSTVSGTSTALELLSMSDKNDDLLEDILATPSDEIGSASGAVIPNGTAAATATGGEHSQIAHQLLEVHKSHVDQIMETLKIEMDALKDFEQVLLEGGPRPTEEEVLDYFESVGLCLDQRTTAGNILRRGMDRMSRG